MVELNSVTVTILCKSAIILVTSRWCISLYSGSATKTASVSIAKLSYPVVYVHKSYDEQLSLVFFFFSLSLVLCATLSAAIEGFLDRC